MNNNNNNNNNCVNINNAVFNNIQSQSKHSRNPDNIFNNPTDIMEKLNILKQSSEKTTDETKKNKENVKVKSTSTNQKVIKENTFQHDNIIKCNKFTNIKENENDLK